MGKTITSVELATSLAKYYGRRTLLVDLDPQASASLFVMQSPELWDAHRRKNGTTFDLFNDEKHFHLAKAIAKDVVPGVDGLHLFPSSPDLVDVDLRLADFIGYNTLQKHLETMQGYYDYIICDCPPNFNPVTKNSLWASDAYVVPTVPDYLSTYGIGLLQRSVNKFFTAANSTKASVPVPALGGIIVTRFKTVGKTHAHFLNQLQHDYNGQVFKHIIHDSITVANAPDNHMPISAMPYPRNKEADMLSNVVMLLRRMPDVTCEALMAREENTPRAGILSTVARTSIQSAVETQHEENRAVSSQPNLKERIAELEGKKYTVESLKALADELGIPYPTKPKKAELAKRIAERQMRGHSEQYAMTHL